MDSDGIVNQSSDGSTQPGDAAASGEAHDIDPIANDIVEALAAQGVAEETAQLAVSRVRTTYWWRAPLPPPSAIAEYEHTLPGSANRIIAMAESNQAANARDSDRISRAFSFGVHVTAIAQPLMIVLFFIGFIVSAVMGAPAYVTALGALFTAGAAAPTISISIRNAFNRASDKEDDPTNQ